MLGEMRESVPRQAALKTPRLERCRLSGGIGTTNKS